MGLLEICIFIDRNFHDLVLWILFIDSWLLFINVYSCHFLFKFTKCNSIGISLSWQTLWLITMSISCVCNSPIATHVLMTTWFNFFNHFDSICIFSVITSRPSIFLKCLISFIQLWHQISIHWVWSLRC